MTPFGGFGLCNLAEITPPPSRVSARISNVRRSWKKSSHLGPLQRKEDTKNAPETAPRRIYFFASRPSLPSAAPQRQPPRRSTTIMRHAERASAGSRRLMGEDSARAFEFRVSVTSLTSAPSPIAQGMKRRAAFSTYECVRKKNEARELDDRFNPAKSSCALERAQQRTNLAPPFVSARLLWRVGPRYSSPLSEGVPKGTGERSQRRRPVRVGISIASARSDLPCGAH